MLIEDRHVSYYNDLGATKGDRRYLAYLAHLCTGGDDVINGGKKICVFFQGLVQIFYREKQSTQ
jgi:hypothetical protein